MRDIFALLVVLVIIVDYLIVGVVVLLTAVGVAAGLLTAHVGVTLRRLLLVQLLAHLVEQLGQLLGGRLDGVGVLALQGLLQLLDTGAIKAATEELTQLFLQDEQSCTSSRAPG